MPFDRRVWQEATTLSQAGADVSVVCPSDDAHPVGTFTIDGVSVIRFAAVSEAENPLGFLREYGASLWRMRKALRQLRRDGRFDVVHYCNPPDLLYRLALPLKRRDGTAVVFDQHDLGPELVQAKRMPLQRAFVATAKFFEKRSYASADRVLATNESYKTVAVQRGGLSAERVTVIRSGPPSNWADDSRKNSKWRRGRTFLLGYVGVMGRQEGIEYLLDATADLIRRHNLDVQVALVGSGPDRDRLEQYARDLNLAGHVEFLGRLPDELMKEVLATSDVCVNPDEVNEMNDLSTMNKIVEYMALGRPIVQFDVREGRFSAQESSLYAEPNNASDFADKVARVLTDRALANRMSEFGRLRFRTHLCWEYQGSQLVQAYSALVQAPH